jgi:iron(III) transport system substrate-binding protein
VGVNSARIDDFRREGIGLNVRPIANLFDVTVGPSGCSCVINRGPHPNAAKVFLDWLLSKQGQTIWNKGSGQNTLRTDIEPGDPALKLTPGVDYMITSREENAYVREDAMKIAKEMLP